MFLWVAKVEESSRGVQPRAASSSSSGFRVVVSCDVTSVW